VGSRRHEDSDRCARSRRRFLPASGIRPVRTDDRGTRRRFSSGDAGLLPPRTDQTWQSRHGDPGLDQIFQDQALSGLDRQLNFMSTAPTFRPLDSMQVPIGRGLGADYRIEAFDINIAKRTALCPGGSTSKLGYALVQLGSTFSSETSP
jgi:hypothetical protein